MTRLIPIFLLGTLILIMACRLLVQAAKRDHGQALTIEDYSGARAVLDLAFAETAAIKRILAKDDLEFILRSGAPEVQRLFLGERKGLALQWLRVTKKRVAQLMDLHLRLASYTFEPNSRFEIRFLVDYLCFILTLNGLVVLLRLFGPFGFLNMVDYTVRTGEHFSSTFSLRLEKIDLVKLGSPRDPRSVQ